MRSTTKDLGPSDQVHEDSLGRLLLRAHRLYADLALSRLHVKGHGELRTAHVSLLPYLDPEGTRASVLAERAGMTKQAASQIVGDLERCGYVQRTADDTDARATRVAFTRRGLKLVADAAAVKDLVDRELVASIGVAGLADLRRLLTHLLDADQRR